MKKKLLAVLGIVLLLSGLATGVVSAGQGDGFVPVTLCHGSPTGAGGSGPANQYEEITVDNQGALNGHQNHPNDIIPAPEEGCPVIEPPACVPQDYNGEEPGCGTPPTEPPACVPQDYNGEEPGCGTPPTEPSPTEPPTEVPTSTPVPPVVVVTPFVPRDVPTCEEMSKMDPVYFATWWSSHWEKLDCPAKGYQTGSGSDFNPTLWLILSGATLLLLSALPNKKQEDAPIA